MLKFLFDNQRLVPIRRNSRTTLQDNRSRLLAGFAVAAAGAWFGHCWSFYWLGIA
jgi:hypothetical protein